MRQYFTLLIGFLTCTAAALPALAQGSGPQVILNDTAAMAAASHYWTPQRMIAAQPYDMPRAGLGALAATAAAAARASSQSSPAGQPTYKGAAPEVKLHDAVPLTSTGEELAPLAVGTAGLRFTNERVVPMNVLRNTYPWKAVGKLFFTGATGGNFVCSASVVNRRVVATAGHCVYDTVVNRFHGNFLFVPGYDNGASPHGSFTWTLAATAASWVAGNGSVPNAADFGVLVITDKVVGGVSRRIGELTGWLGWKTGALVGNDVSAMGYPCNLDACQILQRTSAQVTRTLAPNTAQIGSDHRGGASGGPWVQDWGVASAGQPGRELGGNVMVGITSYGPVATTPRYLGSSILNNEWVAIWNIACGQPRACS